MPTRTSFSLSGIDGQYYATIFFLMPDGRVEKLEGAFESAPQALEWLARKNFEHTGKILVITEHDPHSSQGAHHDTIKTERRQSNTEKERLLKETASMDAEALDLAGFAISCGGDGLFQVRVDYMHPQDPGLGMYDGRNKFADVDEMLRFIKSTIIGVNLTKLKPANSPAPDKITHNTELETL